MNLLLFLGIVVFFAALFCLDRYFGPPRYGGRRGFPRSRLFRKKHKKELKDFDDC
jgi:hypothetical protein